MTRVRRIISITMLIALMLAPVPSAGADEGSIHSGTIVTAYGSLAGGEAGSCGTAPDCEAWLQSGCDPALAGRDPALTASIEDVSKIADGRTPWLFELQVDCCRGQVMIQLWQPDCTEIRGSRWVSADCLDASIDHHCWFTSIRIPESARWMTVTANTGYIPWVGELLKPLTVNWWLSEPPARRIVDLGLRGHLSGVGTVVTDDPSCRSEVPVVLQEKASFGWFEMGTETTDADGAFEVRLSDRPARYRAVALPISSLERTCLGSISEIVRHRH